ncbi:hypothetical protein E2605_19045 [Dysgonomonas capnocytophagoides]|uniref:Uncharacterized protein n=1 Tax=Dysgonomonas capnocytophagoides TaxID=45254 RepID=A0A4Y8KX35_9BACT|nr:hypothetical protein [Dysgonomonas capnocytophagoides]TFD91936.1 hypothetical protein E2605_19045 [Dysgonomonas capnocytophagoides]
MMLKYIDRVLSSTYRNIIVASEKDNRESFDKLLDFALYKLALGALNKSKEVFSESVLYFARIYPSIAPKYRDVFMEKWIISFTTQISLSKDVYYTDKIYHTLISQIKKILETNDHVLFDKVLKTLEEHWIWLKDDDNPEKSKCLFSFLAILLCWIYFLKFQGKISLEQYHLNFIETSFEEVSSNFNFINAFYSLYDAIDLGLWGVDRWEIEEPPMGVAYWALMPSHWMPIGLVLILLKYNYTLIPNDYGNIELKNRFKYELDSIKPILDKIKIENKEYIDFIFGNVSQSKEELESQLNYRKEKVIDVFTYLKKEMEISEYKKIKAIPLSAKKIETFRNKVGHLWEENSVVINLLKNFHRVNYLQNIEDKNGYGYFETIKKAKFAFIDGDYYQEIHGLDHYGGNLARSVDNRFFKEVLGLKKSIHCDDIDVCIGDFIDKLEDTSNILIFANWHSLDSSKNISLGRLSELPHSNKYYSYNNIKVPIVNPFSNYDSYIFILDFSNIEVDVYQNDTEKWYKKELLVDVTEYQKEDITDSKIKEWTLNDGYDYTSAEVDILESNNINIKVICKNDFKFRNPDNFLIIEI